LATDIHVEEKCILSCDVNGQSLVSILLREFCHQTAQGLKMVSVECNNWYIDLPVYVDAQIMIKNPFMSKLHKVN